MQRYGCLGTRCGRREREIAWVYLKRNLAGHRCLERRRGRKEGLVVTAAQLLRKWSSAARKRWALPTSRCCPPEVFRFLIPRPFLLPQSRFLWAPLFASGTLGFGSKVVQSESVCRIVFRACCLLKSLLQGICWHVHAKCPGGIICLMFPASSQEIDTTFYHFFYGHAEMQPKEWGKWANVFSSTSAVVM